MQHHQMLHHRLPRRHTDYRQCHHTFEGASSGPFLRSATDVLKIVQEKPKRRMKYKLKSISKAGVSEALKKRNVTVCSMSRAWPKVFAATSWTLSRTITPL